MIDALMQIGQQPYVDYSFIREFSFDADSEEKLDVSVRDPLQNFAMIQAYVYDGMFFAMFRVHRVPVGADI